jgi:hypothetical protein
VADDAAPAAQLEHAGRHTGVSQHVLTAHTCPVGQSPDVAHTGKLRHGGVLSQTHAFGPSAVVTQPQGGVLLH